MSKSASSGEPGPRSQLSRGARKRAVRRDALLKAQDRSTRRRGWAPPIFGGIAAVLVLGGLGYAGSVFVAEPAAIDTTAQPASLSASTAQYVCPAAPRLPSGADETTDAEFSPMSSDASSQASVALLSDLAGRLPGTTLRPATTAGDAEGGPEAAAETGQELTESQPEDVQQGLPASSNVDGEPVSSAWTQRVSQPGGEAAVPSTLTIEPMGSEPGNGSGIIEYSATDGDLTGLDVSACTTPAHQQWLNGADTTLGSTAVLVVTNPSASAATVDLSLFGAEGLIDSPGTSGLVLGPDQTRSFILGGLAPDEANLAVQVRSSGGAVSASVQQHRLFGVLPGGVDLITDSAGADARQVIPGVSSPGPEAIEELNNQDELGEDDDVAPAVQIAATGSATTAEVTAVGPEGPVSLGADSVVELDAASTGSVDLSGLPEGQYALEVTADAPVMATARSVAGTPGESIDTALAPAAAELGFEQTVALPEAGTSEVVTYAETGGTVEYQVIDGDGQLGETQAQEIAENATATIDPGENATGIRMTTTDSGVHAGVQVTDGASMISSYPVNPPATNSSGVPVRIGY